MVTESSEANVRTKRERPESKGQSIEPFGVTFSPGERNSRVGFSFYVVLFIFFQIPKFVNSDEVAFYCKNTARQIESNSKNIHGERSWDADSGPKHILFQSFANVCSTRRKNSWSMAELFHFPVMVGTPLMDLTTLVSLSISR